MDQLLQSMVDDGLLCCSLHVAQNGKNIYTGYFGWEDIGCTRPLGPESIFRMASMSKLPLYTALMMLYEQGRIVMDDPISRYFPKWEKMNRFEKHIDGSVEIVPCARPILVRDTLTMSSGLPYCFRGAVSDEPVQQSMASCMKPLWDRGHYSLQEEIDALSEVTLDFEPGTHWRYGFSSELAAGIVEKVCDKPYEEAVTEMVFDPLGMEHTRSHYFGDIRAHMTDVLAQHTDGTYTPATIPMDSKHEPGPEHEEGCARLFSTGDDYTRLMQMLACGGSYDGVRLLGRKTIDLMRRNTLNAAQMEDFFDAKYGYGYGYGVRTVINPALGSHNGSLGSFGWTGGFGTMCEADPEDGVSIVFMQNLFPATDERTHLRIRAAAYGLIE